jgi:hypothetical protein
VPDTSLDGWSLALIALYVVAIIGLPLLLLGTDIFKAYRFASATRQRLIDKAATNELSLEELNALLAELRRAPPGIPGLARASLAIAVLMLLGVAIVHVLVIQHGRVDTGVDRILSLVGGVLATIVGFYFGGRTAESAAQQTTPLPVKSQSAAPGAPQITDIQPRQAAAGSLVSIRGSGFGTTQGSGTVKFNNVNSPTISRWSDSEIQASLPHGALGFVEVVVILGNGATITAPPDQAIAVE